MSASDPTGHQIAFGPVPSRRLGQSLGINNVPRKHCTYSCVYCQLGATAATESQRRAFFEPRLVAKRVADRVSVLRERGESIDYLSFVPDGEPTLDVGLGQAIELLRPLGIPIAVITNGTLLSLADVRKELTRADWVSMKVDGHDEASWRRMNRPDAGLSWAKLVAGMRAFAADFEGRLFTESMIIRGWNDSPADLRATARFVAELGPEAALLNTPVRPSHDADHHAPPPAALREAERIFSEAAVRVEVIGRPAVAEFASTGDFEADLLGITAVHPIREDELRAFVAKSGATWAAVEALLEAGHLTRLEHHGELFFLKSSSS